MFKVRAVVAGGVLAGAFLMTPSAHAAGYTMDIHVDSLPGADGAGNYTLKNFVWGEPARVFPKGVSGELTFTHVVDNSSVTLMQAASVHREVKTAELHVRLVGGTNTTIVTIHMTDVHFQAVRAAGSNGSPDAKSDESVTLKFEKVEYTFQNTGPDGKPLGAPVKFAMNFGEHDHDQDH